MVASHISVVIPAYNAESFILDALNSICKQTLPPDEVIVINDGSVDRTSDVLREWIAYRKPSFPVIVIEQVNRGISGSRNVGILKACSRWVAFLDADDIYEPSHLEEFQEMLATFPEAVAVYGAGRLLADGVLQETRYDDFWDNPSAKYGVRIADSQFFRIGREIFPRLIQGNFIKPSSLLVVRSVALEIGLFNEKLGTAEDREFLVRLIIKGDFVYSPNPITQYRWHENNASQLKNSKRNIENGLKAIKIIIDNKKLGLNDTEILACETMVLRNLRDYAYVCSCNGLGDFYRGNYFVYENYGLCWNIHCLGIKNLIRAFISSVPRLSHSDHKN